MSTTASSGSPLTDGGEDGPPDANSDDGGPGDAGADVVTGPPPVCDPNATWGPGALLNVSTSMDDVLDAITPDELTIVWTTGSGASATLLVADRSSATGAFAAPQSVPVGTFLVDRVGVSPDGLRLAVVNADRQGFSELVRAARGGTFGAPTAGTFGNFQGALATGLSYGDPVLSADDVTFYYSVFGAAQTMTVYRAERLLPTDAWPTGAPLPASAGLAPQGSERRQPTGISSDKRTLFFWDQVSSTERAAWVDEGTGAYDSFVDLGSRAFAAPNAACTNLYYSAAGASSEDLFVAAH